MRISWDSARRRNRERSSLTSASAARRIGRPARGEPTRRFRFGDDGEDFDSFARDVIKHSHLSDPEPILGLAQSPQAFDPALAHPGGRVAQVPLDGVPYFGPTGPAGRRIPAVEPRVPAPLS